MQTRPLFILLTAFLFFTLFVPSSFKPRPKSSSAPTLLPGLPSGHSAGANLWRGLVIGDERAFSRQEKKIYFTLGLGHLFTPSGVHLATLNPLISLIPKAGFLFASIALISLVTPGWGALGRVALLKVSSYPSSSLICFCFLLMLEGALFSWKIQPLSWTCSWLFLGLCWFAPSLEKALWFILAQLMLCWVFQQPYSSLAPLTNYIMGLLLIPIFPAALLLSFFPSTFLHQWLEEILTQLHQGVMLSDQLHRYFPILQPHTGHLLLVASWLSMKGRVRLLVPPFLLLTLSAPVNVGKLKNFSLSFYETTPGSEAQLGSTHGLKSFWSDGTKCERRWKGDEWEETCRRPSGKKRRHKKKETKKLS